MTTVTATDLARRTNQVLDALARGESITITRNNTVLGTISPPERAVTLRDAFERIPKMPPEVADRYMADIRNADFDDEVRDPWQK
ncbi:MAG: type II toxin-antitoxin system Phd/YefM family antitoxin [Trinickia sp.]|uniref:type II toxin-antitoxin system Phd/YefM family antitoxin n=1 Tax=Trinickia sp. TaxID=2571163 RepID=UPI003F809C19